LPDKGAARTDVIVLNGVWGTRRSLFSLD